MEKVINCFMKRPDAVTRLICFPWAGGGSIHYARWGNLLSGSIEGNDTLHDAENVLRFAHSKRMNQLHYKDLK